jgi:hypothetical protein
MTSQPITIEHGNQIKELSHAVVCALNILTLDLQRQGIKDAIFILAVGRAGASLDRVQMASNLPPDLADEFLQLLALRAENETKESLQ